MKIQQRTLMKLIICFVLFLSIMSNRIIYANSVDDSNSNSFKANEITLDLANGVIVITATGFKQGNSSGSETQHTGGYIITGTYPQTSLDTDVISITGGTEANPIPITLDNVIIRRSSAEGSLSAGSPISVGSFGTQRLGAHVSLTLKGNNLLEADSTCAGIELMGQNNVPTETTSLKINGDGLLTAKGGASGAGIGTGMQKIAKQQYSVIIESGTINATGGQFGAGIGGGKNGSGGKIIINGGKVNAQGGNSAAGIGGGIQQTSSSYWDLLTSMDIVINGGIVNATGGDYASGIGTGRVDINSTTYAANSKELFNITIAGGEINVAGGKQSAAVGAGYTNYLNYINDNLRPTNPWQIGKISISDGELYALGGRLGAGIGTCIGTHADEISITGGSITAIGGGGLSGYRFGI